MRYRIIGATLLCCLPAAAGEFYDGPSLPASCWKSVDCLMDKGGMALVRTRAGLAINYSLAKGLAARCPGVEVNEEYFRRGKQEMAISEREFQRSLKEIGPAKVRPSACKKLRRGIIQDEAQKDCDRLGGGSGCPSVDGATLKELPIVTVR